MSTENQAKQSFAFFLKNKENYEDVKIISKPADIIAKKGNKTEYYEIKATTEDKKYFGAATETEWEQAYKNPECYFFVIMQKTDNGFRFKKYTPSEFANISSIPPFKIYFTADLSNFKDNNEILNNKYIEKQKQKREVKRIKLNPNVFEKIHAQMEEIRKKK